MLCSIRCSTKPTLYSMNEGNQHYIYLHNGETSINFKHILQEKNNFKELDQIINTLKDIKKTTYHNNPDSFSDEYKTINHCLDSLKNVLMLSAKIVELTNQINNLPKKVPNNKTILWQSDIGMLQQIPLNQGIANCVYVFSDDFLFTYVESLLIQSQALLDKIAVYIKNFKLSINRNYYFYDLKNAINNLTTNNPNDKLYKCIKHETNIALPNLYDLVVATGVQNRKTLRNKIVHEETLITLTDNALVAYRTKKNKIVKFDIPLIATYPCLMETVEKILHSVPRFGVNVISAIINDKYNKKLRTKRKLNFKWKNTFIDYRPYEITDMNYKNKVKLNKFTLSINGFSLDEFYYVKRSLFN